MQRMESFYGVIFDNPRSAKRKTVALHTPQFWSKMQRLMEDMGEDDKKDPLKIWGQFQKHLVGTPNNWVMHLELAAMKQTEEETIDDFIVRLKSKAALCAYAPDDMKDEAITTCNHSNLSEALYGLMRRKH